MSIKFNKLLVFVAILLLIALPTQVEAKKKTKGDMGNMGGGGK